MEHQSEAVKGGVGAHSERKKGEKRRKTTLGRIDRKDIEIIAPTVTSELLNTDYSSPFVSTTL
jgi:hypothetical protein